MPNINVSAAGGAMPAASPNRTPTRRAILAAAPVAALVAAVPALAVPSNGTSFPDLAQRWAQLYPRWLDYMNKSTASRQRFEARVLAATGLMYEEAMSAGGSVPQEYRAIRGGIIQEGDPLDPPDPTDEDGRSILWEELSAELSDLFEEIVSRPVRSIEDLALQAQIFAADNFEYWLEDDPRRPGTATRRLVENLCALAGVVPLPGLDGIMPLDDAADEA